jgi:hypothetical protein
MPLCVTSGHYAGEHYPRVTGKPTNRSLHLSQSPIESVFRESLGGKTLSIVLDCFKYQLNTECTHGLQARIQDVIAILN